MPIVIQTLLYQETEYRVGWSNLSLVFGLPSHENFKLTTSGKVDVPLPQMVLPLTITVQFLAELDFH